MLMICWSIRMCELKYIGSFITVLFMQPMQDAMLEYGFFHDYVTFFLWKQEYPEKTTDLPQVTNKLYHTILYGVYLAWTGFELTTLVVIGTDCIGSCKSNYHTITATTTPNIDTGSFISTNLIFISECCFTPYTIAIPFLVLYLIFFSRYNSSWTLDHKGSESIDSRT